MLAIDRSLEELGVTLGWLTADVVIKPSDESLLALLAEQAATIHSTAMRPQDHPAIAATRQAYKLLGKDPARYRPAAEALRRRVSQGKELFQINNIIEINNLVSLMTGISIGSYDRATLHPPIVLRAAKPDEYYHGIGRGSLNLEGLPVLCDAHGPFGSPTSDSERSMIRDATRSILMVFFLFNGIDAAVLDWSLISDLLIEHAHATNLNYGVV